MRLYGLSVALICTLACAKKVPPPVSTPATVDSSAQTKALHTYLDKVFEERVALYPQFATYLGSKDRYGEWNDISDAFAKSEQERLSRHWQHVQSNFALDQLDEQGRISYELFEYQVKQAAEDYRWRLHTYPVNQMRGLHTAVPTFLANQHTISNSEDARAYIQRLRGVSALFATLMDNMRQRQEMGVLPPRFVYPLVLRAVGGVLKGRPFTQDPQDSIILADFRKKTASLPDHEALVQEAEQALLDSVGPAYAMLADLLKEQEKLASTDDGVWKLPQGQQFYAAALRKHTTTNRSANEIHELGKKEVSRIHDEMRGIMGQVAFKGELLEFFAFMRSDPRFYKDNSPEGRAVYLAQAEEYVNAMNERLTEYFGVLPKAALEVRRVEPYRESSSGKAFYNGAAPDGSRPGLFYVNLADMSQMPTYQLEALAYHEGNPGHHMQVSIAQEADHLPKFRRHNWITAYGEGWGLYTELLAKEMGFYKDPYSDFGRLAMELWRACRLVVDTGIHAKKWTREQAIDYLVKNTPNPRGDAEKAIERYIVMPGQATAYKVGMLEVLRLRKEAREALGEDFDIRDFHDQVLVNGPLPWSMVRLSVPAS